MNTRKRLLAVFLCIVMLLTSIPVSVMASDLSSEFIHSVTQIKDMVPDGYTGIFAEEHLQLIEENPDGLYMLMEDIELSGDFTPLCSSGSPFTGVLEGNGHTISGMNITRTDKSGADQFLGLFSCINGARIANLAVQGSITLNVAWFSYDITKDACIGGIAGYATGEVYIENCIADVPVTVDIENRLPYDVHGFGGIVGSYNATGSALHISYCYNMKDISAMYAPGGIIGSIEVNNSVIDIFACYNEGDITATLYSGGIAGDIHCKGGTSELKIHSCANTGTITSAEHCGGILSFVRNNTTLNAEKILISDCLNTGEVIGTATNCPSVTGGIAGQLGVGMAVRCINRANIDGSPKGCAILGYMNDAEDVKDCYWVDTCSTSSGWGNSDRTGALPEANMTNQKLYPALSFDDVWIMLEGMKQPYPTALYKQDFVNTYVQDYIDDTISFSNNSYKYTKIMAGSGVGSFAGVLEDTFDAANMDVLNGLWKGMEFTEQLANSNINFRNEYDALLADLVAGVYGEDIGADYTRANIFSDVSFSVAVMAEKFGAADTIKLEDYLRKMVQLSNSKNYSACGTLLEEILTDSCAYWTYEELSTDLSIAGSVLDVFAVAAEGITDAKEIVEFSVLCKAYSDTIYDLGDMLKEAAAYSMNYDEEGEKAFEVCYDFANKMAGYAENDKKAYYEAAGNTLEGMAGAGLAGVYTIAVGAKMFEANPVLSGVVSGFKFGMPLADGLTKMDDITYNGRMLSMAGVLARGMYDVVQARYNNFAHTKSYEDAEALRLASQLYLNLQVLACDYAIGYSNAKADAFFTLGRLWNKDDIAAAARIQDYKNDLVALKDNGKNIYIGKDGSINGFLAQCPVTVVVEDKSGNEIARLATGNKTTAAGYESSYQLLGEKDDHKAGIYDDDEHVVTIIGESEGTMNLITYITEDGRVTDICYYEDLPVTEGGTYLMEETYLVNEYQEVIWPDRVEKYENPFTDIEGHWGKNNILEAYYDDLVSGITSTTYVPDGTLTRGMFVTILARMAGYDKTQHTGKVFADVKESAYYAAPVKWAADNKIVSGTSATTFSPEAAISRQDMATMLLRYAKYAGIEMPTDAGREFTDSSQIYAYAKEAVNALSSAGVISGYANGAFGPQKTATRAEAATVFVRFGKLVE